MAFSLVGRKARMVSLLFLLVYQNQGYSQLPGRDDNESVYRGKKIADWQPGLKADLQWERLQAVQALVFLKARDEKTLELMANCLEQGSNLPTRLLALDYLGSLGKDVENYKSKIKVALSDKDPAVRMLAISAIHSIGDPGDFADLSKCLQDDDDGVKVAAADAVAALAPGNSRKLLLDSGESFMGQDLSVQIRYMSALAVAGGTHPKAHLAIQEALDKSATSLRREALALISKIDLSRDQAGKLLIRALDDKDEELRLGALQIIADLEFSSEKIARAVAETKGIKESTKLRLAAIQTLQRQGLAAYACLPFLMDSLQDADGTVRFAAVEVISVLPLQEVDEEKLLKVIKNSPADIRISMISLLPKLQSSHGLPDLAIELLNDKDPVIRTNAAVACAGLGSSAKPAVGKLRELLKDDGDAGVREAAALGLGGINEASAVPDLRNALHDRVSQVRMAAALALGQCGANSKIAVPDLIEALSKGMPDERLTMIASLGNIGSSASPAVDKLASLLVSNKDSEFRKVILTAIGQIGKEGKAAQKTVASMAKDKDPEVRKLCAFVLGEIGAAPESAVPVLVDLTKDRDDGVRGMATNTLGDIKAESPLAIDAVIAILRDRSADNRLVACMVLGNLGSKALKANAQLLEISGGDRSGVVRAAASEAAEKTKGPSPF